MNKIFLLALTLSFLISCGRKGCGIFEKIESLTDGSYTYHYKVESGDWWHLIKVDSNGLVLDAIHWD